MLRDFETVTAVKKIIVVNRIAPPIQETLAFLSSAAQRDSCKRLSTAFPGSLFKSIPLSRPQDGRTAR